MDITVDEPDSPEIITTKLARRVIANIAFCQYDVVKEVFRT
jgi:hypothetical protein